MKPLRKYGQLLAGTALGTWIGLHLQFGVRFSPHLIEELTLVAVALLMSFAAVALLAPVSSAFQRKLAAHHAAATAAVAVFLFLAFGFWVYAGFLHRPLRLVLERDWLHVLYFGLGGVGYAAAHALHRRI